MASHTQSMPSALYLFVSSASRLCNELDEVLRSEGVKIPKVRLDTKEQREWASRGKIPVTTVPTLVAYYGDGRVRKIPNPENPDENILSFIRSLMHHGRSHPNGPTRDRLPSGRSAGRHHDKPLQEEASSSEEDSFEDYPEGDEDEYEDEYEDLPRPGGSRTPSGRRSDGRRPMEERTPHLEKGDRRANRSASKRRSEDDTDVGRYPSKSRSGAPDRTEGRSSDRGSTEGRSSRGRYTKTHPTGGRSKHHDDMSSSSEGEEQRPSRKVSRGRKYKEGYTSESDGSDVESDLHRQKPRPPPKRVSKRGKTQPDESDLSDDRSPDRLPGGDRPQDYGGEEDLPKDPRQIANERLAGLSLNNQKPVSANTSSVFAEKVRQMQAERESIMKSMNPHGRD